MKKFIKNLFSVLAITAVFTVVSCDDDDNEVSASITSVGPDEIFAGDDVVLEGTGFENVLFVFFGQREVPFTLNGNAITFTSPEGSLAGNSLVTLAFSDNYRVNKNVFLTPGAPVFGAISASTATPGSQIVIDGSSFDDLQSVTINGTAVTIDSSTQTSITFTVPSGVTDSMGPIVITTPKGSSTVPSTFFVGSETIISDFDENENEWNGIYAAAGSADTDASGISSSDPDPISGNFMKLVFDSTGGWGAGSQADFGGGLTAAVAQIVLVTDFHSNGTAVDHRFQMEVTGQDEWSFGFGAQTYSDWTEIVVPLTDFGNGGADPMDVTSILNVKIQGGAQDAQLNWDNVRFIELSN